MPPRLNYANAFPEGTHAMIQLERTISGSGIEEKLLHLIKTRASQINGCAYCLATHLSVICERL